MSMTNTNLDTIEIMFVVESDRLFLTVEIVWQKFLLKIHVLIFARAFNHI